MTAQRASGVSRLTFAGPATERTAAAPAAKWLVHVRVWQPADPDQTRTGDEETAVVLLSGTFDLIGGSTVWQARGARKEVFGGRPMAVFLPKHTDFRVGNGSGEILLVAARQPSALVEPEGKAALSQRPLLPLAGSGKAFDPSSGDWKPAESFPNAAESLPPRRFERIPVGACQLERVFAPDYKAATLSIDECVVPAGASLRLADVPRRARCDELLVFVRCRSTATMLAAGQTHQLRGDEAFFVPTPGGEAELTISAGDAPCYLLLAYAGKALGDGS